MFLGMPKEKIVLGLVAYGHSWTLANSSITSMYSSASGPGTPFNVSFLIIKQFICFMFHLETHKFYILAVPLYEIQIKYIYNNNLNLKISHSIPIKQVLWPIMKHASI